MKKLMLAAAIVCAAAITQAATYNWSTKGSVVYNGYDSTAEIGTAWSGATATAGLTWYLVCADTISQNDLLAKFRKGEDISTYKLATGATTTAGIALTEFTASDELVRSDGKMYAYFAILSDDGDMLYLNATASQTANTQGGTATIQPSTGLSTKKVQDLDGTASFGAAGWYGSVSETPEPTSGLLLVLGLAGLALRRKHA